MFQTLKLLLPALIPSWRFFDTIAPSPRIEYCLLKDEQDTSGDWQEFRPRAEHRTVGELLKSIFWNARWNEYLFLVSCAERLMQNSTEHSQQEIFNRIQSDLKQDNGNTQAKPYLKFRLVFFYRHKTQLQKQVAYVSSTYRYRECVSL